MHAELEQARTEQAWQVLTTNAWVTAALMRSKRLPSLESLMRPKSRPLTEDERAWAEQIREREADAQRQLQEWQARQQQSGVDEGG